MSDTFDEKRAYSSHAAHWMTDQELIALNSLAPSSSTCIGLYHGQNVYLSNERISKHVLVIGPPEREKTTHALAWFIRDFVDQGQSMVILDPSSVLMRRFGAQLQKTHDTFEIRLDPRAPNLPPDRCLQYNPLAHVPLIDTSTAATKRKTTLKQEQEAAALADVWTRHLVHPLDLAKHPFLARDAQRVMHACILHLRAVAPRAPFADLGKLMNKIYKLFPILEQSSSEGAREIYTRHLAYIQEPYLYELLSALSGYGTDIMQNVYELSASNNEIDFTRLLRKPTVLFYSTPFVYEGRLQRFTSTFFAQLFATLKNAYADWESANSALAPALQPARPCGIRCILEEYTTCGEIPHLEESMAMLAQYNGGLIAAGQDAIGMMEKGSIPIAQTLLKNAATQILLAGAPFEEREMYSRLCGTRSTPEDEIPLVTAEELRNLAYQPEVTGRDVALLYRKDGPPAAITLRDAFAEEELEQAPRSQQKSVAGPSICADEATPFGLIFEAIPSNM